MGLLGKKKTPEELIAEGRAQFDLGNRKKAFIAVHALAVKGHPEACYYIGFYYLREMNDRRMAKEHLITAARAHIRDAAELLAEEYGIRDYLSDAVPASAPVPTPDGGETDDSAAQFDAEFDALREAEISPERGRRPAQRETEPESAHEPESKSEPEPKPEPEPEVPITQDIDRCISEGIAACEAGDFATALPLLSIAAEQGDVKSQLLCAAIYGDGKGTAKDEAKAMYWFEKAAEQGDAEAQFYCGRGYDCGDGVAEDKEKALHWYERAAEQGHGKAQFITGMMYHIGEGTAVDEKKALYWYEKAAAQGVENVEEALACLRSAAASAPAESAQGPEVSPTADMDGEYCLREAAAAAEAGDYARMAEMMELCEKAAEQGDITLQLSFAEHFRYSGEAEDLPKALYWYEKAAQQGDEYAQAVCGMMYSEGRGTEVDKVRAFHWYKKAAEQGYAKAQLHCGLAYDLGSGTAEDETKALYWYEKAAEQGMAVAQRICATTYLRERNMCRAAYWAEKAAEQGEAEAQYIAGILYGRGGDGLTRDSGKAREYLQMCVENPKTDEDKRRNAEHLLSYL